MAKNPLTRKDRTGERVGRLVVLNSAGRAKRDSLWLCGCECGSLTVVRGSNLKVGHTESCGCLHRDRCTIHGHARDGNPTKTYKSWSSMRQRTTNKNSTQWHDYGGRGITCASRWEKFENFLSDMGECPEGLTLERVDNNKGYAPDNCRWATRSEQQLNKRDAGRKRLKGAHRYKDSGRWQGYINRGGVRRYLGCFSTEEEAHAAYLLAADEYQRFGAFLSAAVEDIR